MKEKFLASSVMSGVLIFGLSLSAVAQSHAEMQNRNEQTGITSKCQVLNKDIEQTITGDADRRIEFTPQMMRDLRMMRDTAWRLERYNQSEACQRVVAAMQKMIQNPQRYGMMVTSPGSRNAPDGSDRDGDSLFGFDGHVRADEVIGTDVRAVNNVTIGEVRDLVIGPDRQSSYLIVSYGGFLGIGENASAVPLSSAKITANGDAIVVNVSESELEGAPSFEGGDYSWTEDEDWLKTNRSFYGEG